MTVCLSVCLSVRESRLNGSKISKYSLQFSNSQFRGSPLTAELKTDSTLTAKIEPMYQKQLKRWKGCESAR